MLIDEFLPEYDVVERHRIIIRANRESVFRAIRTADLASAIPVKILLGIRSLPGAIHSRSLARLRARANDPITLGDFEKTGFRILAENPPEEILIGLVGAFWKPRGGIRATDAEHFLGLQEEGTARAAWNFVVHDIGDGKVQLSTETRVKTLDAPSYRAFRTYWFFVRPGSGLIRRYMLRSIRNEAQRSA